MLPLVLSCCLVWLAGVLAPAPAAAADPTPSVYFGALVDGHAPTAASFAPGGAFHEFERQAGKRMSLVHWGQPWKMNGAMQPFQTAYFENVRQHGSIPVLNWCSWELGKGLDQPDFQLRDIYAGTYDAFITQWARDAKDWGHPLMLRFNHEMNGWWFPWGEGETSSGTVVNGNARGDFVKAWRHVHDIFERVGATNVTWLWAPNIVSVTSRYPAMPSVFPGEQYVDWTGLSAYNDEAGNWRAITTLITGEGTNYIRNSYDTVAELAPSKPMMLAEVGSVEAGDGGAQKGAWIRDLLAKLPSRFPKIRGFMWFDWPMAGLETVPIDSSSASLAAFAHGVRAPTFASNSFSDLSESPIPPPSSPAAPTPETVLAAPLGRGPRARVLSLIAVADTYTNRRLRRAGARTGAMRLRAGGPLRATALLEFDVPQLPRRLRSVRLRVRTAAARGAGSRDTYVVRSRGRALGSLPAPSVPGRWYDVDLDVSRVRRHAGGRLRIAIAGRGRDALVLSSRETRFAPRLLVSQ